MEEFTLVYLDRKNQICMLHTDRDGVETEVNKGNMQRRMWLVFKGRCQCISLERKFVVPTPRPEQPILPEEQKDDDMMSKIVEQEK